MLKPCTTGQRGCRPWVEGGGGVGHGLLQGGVWLAGQACRLALILLVASCSRRQIVTSRLPSSNTTCTPSLLVSTQLSGNLMHAISDEHRCRSLL